MDMKILGIVNDEQYKSLRQMTAGLSLFVDGFRAIKGAIGMVEMLNVAEIKLAATETYRAVLHNPVMAGVAGAGLLAAVGTAGYLYGKSRQEVQVNQTVNINGPAPREVHDLSQSTLEAVGGI
jgi:hypothetical protein